jgi:hypothetical protein
VESTGSKGFHVLNARAVLRQTRRAGLIIATLSLALACLGQRGPRKTRRSTQHGRALTPVNFALAVGLVLAASLAASLAPAPPAQARVVILGEGTKGADSCAAPSTSTMKAWWTSTPWSFWGVYIGGVNRACAQPNLTAAWVTAVSAQGWDLEPIWVGLQNPCAPAGVGTKFSTNTTTAYNQGSNEAVSAHNALNNLGFGPTVNRNTTIVLDLEGYTHTAACLAASKAFVHGWDAYLASVPSQVSGVYGSTGGSDLTGLASAPVPAFIWGALWDSNSNTTVMPPVPTTRWVGQQRIKQYRGGHTESWGGVSVSIDSNSANGPVYKR